MFGLVNLNLEASGKVWILLKQRTWQILCECCDIAFYVPDENQVATSCVPYIRVNGEVPFGISRNKVWMDGHCRGRRSGGSWRRRIGDIGTGCKCDNSRESLSMSDKNQYLPELQKYAENTTWNSEGIVVAVSHLFFSTFKLIKVSLSTEIEESSVPGDVP